MFNVKKQGTVTVITLTVSELTVVNASEFKQKVLNHLAGDGSIRHVVLDMEQVKFIDSSGLGSLISLLRSSIDYRQLMALAGMTRPVQALFELMRMHQVFDIYATVDLAEISLNKL